MLRHTQSAYKLRANATSGNFSFHTDDNFAIADDGVIELNQGYESCSVGILQRCSSDEVVFEFFDDEFFAPRHEIIEAVLSHVQVVGSTSTTLCIERKDGSIMYTCIS